MGQPSKGLTEGKIGLFNKLCTKTKLQSKLMKFLWFFKGSMDLGVTSGGLLAETKL